MNAQSRTSLLFSGAAVTVRAPNCRTDLSFMSGSNYWAPERTGNHEEDGATGRRYANELADFMRRGGGPNILFFICKDMPVDRAAWGPVEISFFSSIALALI